MMTAVEIGKGEIRLESNGPVVILPKEAEVIIRKFWREPKRCQVLYDKEEDIIYIVPEMNKTRIKKPLTLHEAISVVIYENGKPMKPSEILAKIKSNDLYRKKNGKYPDIKQIHARISIYSKKPKKLFEKTEDGRVKLTEEGEKIAKEVLEQ